jgi:hypothetical protein
MGPISRQLTHAIRKAAKWTLASRDKLLGLSLSSLM